MAYCEQFNKQNSQPFVNESDVIRNVPRVPSLIYDKTLPFV